MGIAAFGCAAVIGLLIAMTIGAALLRAAVSVANRFIGPVKERAPARIEEWEWDEEPDEVRPRRGKAKAIPEPGVGRGMMIASTANILTAFAAFVLGVIADEVEIDLDDGPALAVFALFVLPFGFAALTVLLVPMLPTTFWRAAQVAFLYHVFGLVVLLVIGGGLFAVVRILDG